MKRLEHDEKLAREWFQNNYMKLNEKLLGLIIDRNLKLDDCVFSLRKNSGRKLSAFARFSSYMSFEKKKKNSFENVCRITIWVLPINLDIPQ